VVIFLLAKENQGLALWNGFNCSANSIRWITFAVIAVEIESHAVQK